LVRGKLADVAGQQRGNAAAVTMQSFRPGRPQPTHRYATAK
jgi:hypothetical protein